MQTKFAELTDSQWCNMDRANAQTGKLFIIILANGAGDGTIEQVLNQLVKQERIRRRRHKAAMSPPLFISGI